MAEEGEFETQRRQHIERKKQRLAALVVYIFMAALPNTICIGRETNVRMPLETPLVTFKEVATTGMLSCSLLVVSVNWPLIAGSGTRTGTCYRGCQDSGT